MRLLITTQSVEKDDPVLGFFCNWLTHFADHFEHVHVICLREGNHSLPANVSVHTLGKEDGQNRLKYVWRFMKYAWTLRKEYDVIFSHMNPHYIVLMGWFWKLAGKRMYLWRNHAKMNLKTWIAAQLASRVFYTSPFACTRRFKHSVQMPVGIDTDLFKPDTAVVRTECSVLLLGRLSPVKCPEVFMEASRLLEGYEFHSYGDDPIAGGVYKRKLEGIAKGRVIFHEAIPNYEAPRTYSAFDIYVNLTPEGSMDKTVLEAAACGALVLVANRSYENLVPEECMLKETTPQAVAESVKQLASMSHEQKELYRKELRGMVEREHSLAGLTEKLVKIFNDGK